MTLKLRRPTLLETRTRAVSWTVNPAGLRPYQVDGARWLCERRRAILADEMRLGKTPQVLRALPPMPRVLVIGPEVVAGVWRELSRTWRRDLRFARGICRPAAGELAFASWDSLDPVAPGWVERLIPEALHDTVVVLDEAHYAKNPQTLRHQRARRLLRQAWIGWLLTATPLHDRPADLEGLLYLAGVPRVGMLRRLSREVGVGLPPRLYETVEVDCHEPRVDLPPSGLPPFAELAEVRRAIAVSRSRHAASLASLLALSGKPVVVACEHVEPLHHVARTLPRAGLVTGAVVGDPRLAVVSAFQRGELDVLCLTSDAGGIGIDLSRASCLIEVDLPWSYGDLVQLEARLDAVGKLDAVTIYRMTSKHPVDVRVAEVVAEKECVARAEVGASDRGAPS